MRRITIDLDDDLKREFDIYCAMVQKSKADLIREWIKEKLVEANRRGQSGRK